MLICLPFPEDSLSQFHKWAIIFISIELLKLVVNCIVEKRIASLNSSSSFRLRVSLFLIDTVWTAWFAYGNVLYNSLEFIQYKNHVALLFIVILIYGYMYLTKYAIELYVFCCILPIWCSCIYRQPRHDRAITVLYLLIFIIIIQNLRKTVIITNRKRL